jgi:hypothetical protein
MSGESSNQNLAGIEEFLKDAEAFLGDSVPNEVKELDEGSGDQGKASHAFKVQKDRLKQATQLIRQLKEEKAKAETPPKSDEGSVKPTPQFNAGTGAAYTSDLRYRAAMNLVNSGINPEQSPDLLGLEINRLYNADVSAMEQQAQAKNDAGKVLETVLTEFPELDDADKAEIKSRVTTLAVTNQADPNSVKQVVYGYRGENLEKFARKASDGNGSGTSSEDRSGSGGSGTAAAVRSDARRGVALGDAGTTSEGDTKPPTAEELREMRKAGIPSSRVDLYRKAKKRAPHYQVH